MTRQQRKKELITNVHVTITVLMYIYLILGVFIELLR